jgi:hypothetical protein
MTKAEKAAFEAMRERAALSWPPPPPKPLSVREELAASGSKVFVGWSYNAYTGEVSQGASDGLYHHRTDPNAFNGERPRTISVSQTVGSPWYSTRADACRALHYEVARECARKLAALERRIEQEAAQ